MTYEHVKRNYDQGLWDASMLKVVVNRGIISPEEYENITTQVYDVLDDTKRIAINQTKHWVDNVLSNPMEFNGKYYSVTLEKQNLLSAQLGLYGLNLSMGTVIPLSWNATGEPCQDWEFTDLLALSNAIAVYVKPIVGLQQQVEQEIRNASAVEQVQLIIQNFREATKEYTI